MPHSETIVRVRIDRIVIGDRARREMGDLSELAESIAAHGLLQPIGITADRYLVFGERRLRACSEVLGRTTIDARVVDVSSITAGEYAENEMRKDFTPTERIAIAIAVKAELGERHGSNQFRRKGEEVDGGPPPAGSKTRDIAAKRAGFGSGKQLERAEAVVASGVSALVGKMDDETLSISAAAEVAELDPDRQNEILDQIDAGELTPSAVRRAVRQIAREMYPAPDLPTPAEAREQAKGSGGMVLANDSKYYGYLPPEQVAEEEVCNDAYQAILGFREIDIDAMPARVAAMIVRYRPYQKANVERALAFFHAFKEAWDGQQAT